MEEVSAETEEKHADDKEGSIILPTVQDQIDSITIARSAAISSNFADTAFLQNLQKMHALLLHECSSKARQIFIDTYLKGDNFSTRVLLATHFRPVNEQSLLLAPVFVHCP